MTINFTYQKGQVMQALRYHFISRPEIRTMIILVNVFTLASIVLYAMGKILPLAFLVGSTLWLVLMISFWFVLPAIVYRRTETFKHSFSMEFEQSEFTLKHERGQRRWDWKALTLFKESPHFFFLYFDSRSFFLVPKSGFETLESLQDLRALLREKTAAKKK